VTSVQKDSSKDAPIPNMLPSSLSSSPWPKEMHVSIARFRISKQVMKRGITTFKSYSRLSQIASPLPTKFSTILNYLNWGWDIITSMLWTWFTFLKN
jgi:hypothetical protein